MEKLQEYYRFFDMFKGKFNDDRFSKAGRLAPSASSSKPGTDLDLTIKPKSVIRKKLLVISNDRH